MNKPAACVGCSWYQEGHGYVPDQVSPVSVMLLTGSPDSTSESMGLPLQGRSGKDTIYHFLPLAGLDPTHISVAQVTRCRARTPGLTPLAVVSQECATRHSNIPSGTRLIIAQGEEAFNYAHNYSLRDADGKPAKLSNWRGFTLPLDVTAQQFGSIPVYCVLGVDDIYSNPGMETVTEWDWIKVRNILDGTYPKPLPPRLLATPETFSETLDWFTRARTSRWVVCDTEFIPGTKHLTVLGLLSRSKTGELQGLQVDWRNADPALRHEVLWQLRELVREVPFIFHNCRADITVLEAVGNITWNDYCQYEDTMLAHAVLWCELPHSLEFVASMWGQYQKLKHLKNNDELLYNFGDCLETDSIWYNIVESSFKHDPQAEHIYRSQHLPLCPIVEKTVTRGLRVNHARVAEARTEYEARVRQAERLALATAGWPININSPRQLGWYLYHIRGLPLRTNKDSGNPTIDDAAIASLRMELGPAFDPEEELTYDHALERIAQGADPILEARVLYAGAQTRLIKYIYPLYEAVGSLNPFNFKKTSDYEKAYDLAIEHVRTGVATTILDRIHPDMLTHTQKTGRWSTVDPPIAQLPSDLRNLVCPDPGEVWISWDWKSIEPRVLEALCHSRVLRRSFDEGIDLHTWTVCVIFNYEFPPNLVDPHKSPESQAWRELYRWKGGDDPRRVFAKTGRYEMYYGGTGANAAEAAALFGLDPRVLKKALGGLLSADPEYYAWRLQLEEQIKRTRMVRTFMGRPRRFLKGGQKMIREGLDQPMQGAVSDIFNTTIVAIDRAYREVVQFAWGIHDSQKWACSMSRGQELLEKLKVIAERPHVINGRVTHFPVDIHLIYPPESQGDHKEAA